MRKNGFSTRSEIEYITEDSSISGRGGYILDYYRGKKRVYSGEAHCLVSGVSGSGKSRRFTIPLVRSLVDAKESVIVVDPKGEIYRNTICYAKKHHKTRVIDFRNVCDSDRYNIFNYPAEYFHMKDPRMKQIGMESIDNLAYNLYPNSVVPNESVFWTDSGRSLFLGLVYVLMTYAEPKEINLNSLYNIIAYGDDRMGAKTVLSRFVDDLPEDSIAAMLLNSYITTAEETKAGIKSTFLEGISKFVRSDGMISMLSDDDMHINSLDGETPLAVYIILPDENPIFDKIAGVLCSQLLEHFIRLAQNKYNGTLPRRLTVCLEELGNIGSSITNLPHLMSAGRSRNIRCCLVLQNLEQLDMIYGKSGASTIKNNADIVVAFRTNDWNTLKELSDKAGEREVKRDGCVVYEKLITPDQLGAMETGQAFISVSGRIKYITWFPDYSEMFDCSDWSEPVVRKRRCIKQPCVFDIVGYVKERSGYEITV